jgi:hypothetical protein
VPWITGAAFVSSIQGLKSVTIDDSQEALLDGDTPAWLISLLVHFALMVALTFVGRIPSKVPATFSLTSSAQTHEVRLDDPEEFYFSPQPQDRIGANSQLGAESAQSIAPLVADSSVVPVDADRTIKSRFLEVTDSSAAQMAAAIQPNVEVAQATGLKFNENLTVKGAVGVGTTGAVGAIDRISHEILLSLEERKTLVVWFFDETMSLEKERAAILERFDRIYDELGVIEAAGNPAFRRHDKKPLLTSVVGFGKEFKLLTREPTDQLDEVKAAVNGIKTDVAGIENTFSAVLQGAQLFRKYRVQSPIRNVMFVVFTDEAGDDDSMMDQSINVCRRLEIPVYVVGAPAPFGRRDAMVKYVDPDPNFDQTPQWVAIQQGPESFMPELVQIGFGDDRLDEAMDSGFGPYGLTRLCFETGGIYFTVHPSRDVRGRVRRESIPAMTTHLAYFFDPEVMRTYRPDYVSVREYQQLLAENKARQALVAAASKSALGPMEEPRTRFPKRDDAALANLLSDAQKAAAILEPKIDALYKVLSPGVSDRGKLTQPRWQAGFDLAMGRVLALKVRTESYNIMLAKAKQGMKFENPKHDTWELRPSDEIGGGSTFEKWAKEAQTYLQRVVEEHEGTPWALMAQAELKQPMGWQWEERYTGVNAPREVAANNNNNVPRPRPDERAMMLRKPPPKRPAPRL